ncbi:hypothetical protein VCRA2125O343_240059 [Vibrio crassostreae]|nr:hypothetical protein VCRA2125O343_240059 [Vibrio crassostreae]
MAHNLLAFAQLNQTKFPAGPEVPISCVKPLFTLPPMLCRAILDGELVNNFPLPTSNTSVHETPVFLHIYTSTLTVLLVTLSLVAVIVVCPTSTPASRPVGVTVAVLRASEVQVTESLTSEEVPSL